LATIQPEPDQFDTSRRLTVARRLVATESQTSVADLVTTSEALASPGNFWAEFRTALVGLSGADIQRVAQDYLRPGAFTIVAVGDSVGVNRAAAVASPR
jgi:predicted Zn-dependent peptidase